MRFETVIKSDELELEKHTSKAVIKSLLMPGNLNWLSKKNVGSHNFESCISNFHNFLWPITTNCLSTYLKQLSDPNDAKPKGHVNPDCIVVFIKLNIM